MTGARSVPPVAAAVAQPTTAPASQQARRRRTPSRSRGLDGRVERPTRRARPGRDRRPRSREGTSGWRRRTTAGGSAPGRSRARRGCPQQQPRWPRSRRPPWIPTTAGAAEPRERSATSAPSRRSARAARPQERDDASSNASPRSGRGAPAADKDALELQVLLRKAMRCLTSGRSNTPPLSASLRRANLAPDWNGRASTPLRRFDAPRRGPRRGLDRLRSGSCGRLRRAGRNAPAIGAPSAPRPSRPTAAAAVPDAELRVACDGTHTTIANPLVRTQPDGVHVRFENTSGSDLSVEWSDTEGNALFGDGIPAAGATLIYTFGAWRPPGRLRGDAGRVHRRRSGPALQVARDVVRGEGVWRVGHHAAGTDYAEGATGATGDVVDIARSQLRGSRPTTSSSTPGTRSRPAISPCA